LKDLDEVVKNPQIVMPDLIRHPEPIEFTGFRLSPDDGKEEKRLFTSPAILDENMATPKLYKLAEPPGTGEVC